MELHKSVNTICILYHQILQELIESGSKNTHAKCFFLCNIQGDKANLETFGKILDLTYQSGYLEYLEI